MWIHNLNTHLCTLLKRLTLGGLLAFTLSASSLRPAAAIPPGGGEPDPTPTPTPLPQPDLYISDLVKFDAHHVLVYVRNKGTKSSAPCPLQLITYLYDAPTGLYTVYTTSTVNVPAIQPGGFSTVWTTTEPSIYFSHFYFYFQVDPNNVVAERNEQNNASWFCNP